MSKFYLANALIEVNQTLGFSILLISSFLNAVYFIPIIINGFLKENKQHDKDMHKDPLPLTMRISLVSLLIINLALGFYPNILKSIIDTAITSFIR
ncbi:MAG: hypothetical protein LRY28_04815 [Erysipelotrichaceae bacterium]|nr:hypothetical protein [Erysipelotrichaceae bacterium]